ncbi:MAG: glycerophosphodiester phosphodiesterase [Candidatus Micrarchaeia archaeon]|jgi:glycerophosphoryl diester phosphodiesterase
MLELKVGHRGAGGEAPENTLKSFEEAIKSKAVNAIELDVRRTKDKKLIVMHDDKLKRLAGIDKHIFELSLREIKEIDIKGEKIPTLKEALEFIDHKVKHILIEIKEPGYEDEILKEAKSVKDIAIIVSFHEEALERVRTISKDIETGFIYVNEKKPIEKALALGAQYLLPLYRFTHSEDIQKAHEKGLKVIVWTINTREEAEEYAKKGVDGIATDYPEILRGL